MTLKRCSMVFTLHFAAVYFARELRENVITKICPVLLNSLLDGNHGMTVARVHLHLLLRLVGMGPYGELLTNHVCLG